jgi:starch phosphorylase
MVQQYVDDVYLDAARLIRERRREGGRAGRELFAWHARLVRHWRSIHFGSIEIAESDGQRQISVPVYLGEITSDDVAVELYAEPGPDGAPVRETMIRVAELPGAVNGFLYRASVPTERPAGDYTPRVVPRRDRARVPIEATMIAWQR